MRRMVVTMALLVTCQTVLLAEECAIDTVMKEQLSEVNAKSKAAVELYKEPDLEKESCLPAISALSGQFSASIPSFTDISRALATKIRDMGCKAANDAILETAEALNVSWEAPFGLGDTGVGVGSDGSDSGVTVSKTDETTKLLEGEIMNAAGALTDTGLGVVSGGVEANTGSVTGVRTADAEKYDDKIRQMREAIRERKKNALDNY